MANKVIDRFIGRDCAMHGIMSSNKKARIQVHLNKNHQVNHWITPLEIPTQEKNERSEPKCNYS